MTQRPRLRLTPQQQAIVAHDTGPALVYAVAGAGKTTAMVHRIARLVADGLFPAWQILATSFNRDANRQIEEGLRRWPSCADVRVKTLHAVGYAVIRLAGERGYLPPTDLKSATRNPSAVERDVLYATLAAARADRVPYAAHLDRLDTEDFLGYVRICKANLRYPDTGALDMPRRRRRSAQRATAPDGHAYYLDLFCRYERTRQQQGALTFDDMLTTGWALLARHEDLLAEMRRRHRCLLVDEYQDVNRAQAEMLDLISGPDRNYMVIGDDDQAIYEWRGASPQHMRGFSRRYRRVATYLMTDNFRSQALQLALANRVIQQDGARQPKYLQLTRGFGGLTQLELHPDEVAQAGAVARRIGQLRQAGQDLGEMAILVRVYAQASALTAALFHAGIGWTMDEEQTTVGRVRRQERTQAGRVTITSMYKAKGLEWPVVFVPGCNGGTVPLARADNVDEERRLFYVALTRARDQLYLHALANKPLSPFLEEAQMTTVLDTTAAIQAALIADPATWTLDDYLAVAVNAKRLYFHEYLAHWWDVSPGRRRAVSEAVLRFYATLRRKRLFRPLGMGRQDVVLWRQIAGGRVAETPLDRPDIDAGLSSLR